jgi:hypothetical protein
MGVSHMAACAAIERELRDGFTTYKVLNGVLVVVCGGAGALIRHCEERSDEAIHVTAREEVLDCFAPLAMTRGFKA